MGALASADGDGEASWSLLLLLLLTATFLVGVIIVLFSAFSFSLILLLEEEDADDVGNAMRVVTLAGRADGALVVGPPRASEEEVAMAKLPGLRCDLRRPPPINDDEDESAPLLLPPREEASSLWLTFLLERCIVYWFGLWAGWLNCIVVAASVCLMKQNKS